MLAESEAKQLAIKRSTLLRAILKRQEMVVALVVFTVVAMYYAVLGHQLFIEPRYNMEEPIRLVLTTKEPIFEEIGTHADVWNWLENVIVPSFVVETEEGRPLPPSERYFFKYYNRVWGGIYLKKTEFDAFECSPELSMGIYQTCFDTRDGNQTDFSVPDITSFASDCLAANFTAADPNLCNFTIVANPNASYLFLPLYWGQKGAIHALRSMREQNWINRQTESLRVSLILWNAPLHTAIRTILTLTFDMSGNVDAGENLFSLPLSFYWKTSHWVRLAFEGLLIVFVVVVTGLEINQFKKAQIKSALDSNVYMTMIIVASQLLFVVAIVLWPILATSGAKFQLPPDFLVSGEQFQHVYSEYDGVQNLLAAYIIINNINAVFCILRVVWLLQLFKQWRILTKTILLAAPNILAFVVFTIIFMIFFGFLSNINFGNTYIKFSNFGLAMETLVMLLLGDVDYQGVRSTANPVWVAIFFSGYLIVIIFIFLNVFIGIITHAYELMSGLESKKEQVTSEQQTRSTLVGLWRFFRSFAVCSPEVHPEAVLALLDKIDAKAEVFTFKKLSRAQHIGKKLAIDLVSMYGTPKNEEGL